MVSVTDGIDTGTGMVADMFLTLLAVVANYERALISDRTRSSLRVLKERGVELGRPRKVTPVIIKQVQTMHSDPDVSVKDVCASLGITHYLHIPESTRRSAVFELGDVEVSE